MEDNKIREIRIIRENPRFRQYPEYKQSGVGWVGKIPNYWETVTIKHLTKNLDGKRIPLSSEVRADQEKIYPYYGANGIIDYVKDYIFEGEHILIGEDGAPFFDKTREVSLLASGKFWVNNHCHILKNIGTSEPRFIVHCLNSVDYFQYITGSTRDKLTQADLNRIKIPVPPIQEQTQIANFLDRKTGQIDELIRIKERQIELLQEQRAALINQAVTKGLDPNLKMKPSGVEWIGEIPAHWEVLKVKHVGLSNPSKNNPKTACLKEDPVVFLPMERVHTDGTIDQELRIPYSQLKSGYTYFEEGDILIAKVTPCFENGKIVLIKNLATPVGFGSTEFIVIRPNLQKVFSPFLYYILRSDPLRSIGKHFMTSAIGLKRVPTEFVESFRIPIPTYQEQAEIANFLDHKTEQIDKLIATEQRKIQLLKEYRQSLISEAVTGKIDVRNEV